MPLGATIASDRVYDAFGEPFAHGHTYGSHPVACAAGGAVMEYLVEHNLVDRSRELGEYLHKQLQRLYDHPTVGDIRGMGLFAGIEFVQDKESKEPFPADTRFNARVVDQCFENGLLVYPGSGTVDGFRGDHIQVAPPLMITREGVDTVVELLDTSIGEVEEKVLGA